MTRTGADDSEWATGCRPDAETAVEFVADRANSLAPLQFPNNNAIAPFRDAACKHTVPIRAHPRYSRQAVRAGLLKQHRKPRG
jgi:hypothetical protein